MKHEKTCYQFVFNCDPNFVKRTIDEYLQINNYKFVQKKNASYFLLNDLIQGKRFFEYYFNGNMVVIYVYLNSYKHPWPLDDAYTGSIPKQAYKEALVPLFSALDQLGNSNPYMPNIPTPALQNFVADNQKQKGNLAIISFVFALLSVLLAFTGISYGIIILVCEIYMASLGLRSDKKGFAIAAFCLAGLSFVILALKYTGAI